MKDNSLAGQVAALKSLLVSETEFAKVGNAFLTIVETTDLIQASTNSRDPKIIAGLQRKLREQLERSQKRKQ